MGTCQSVHTHARVGGEAKFKGKCVTVSEPECDHVPGTECVCMSVRVRACVCECACMQAHMYMSAHMCVQLCVHVSARVRVISFIRLPSHLTRL